MSLRNKAINGILWNALQSFGTRFIQLIITIIIARILLPTDYGLIGMLYIFIALGGVVLDGGFGQALIRKESVNQIEYSSVFYFNILVSVIIYACLYIVAPYIGEFYNEPRLTDIARMVFLIFPIKSLALIQNAIIIKNVNFRLLAKVTLVSSLISGVAGVVYAYMGYGVWALVYQTLISSIMTVMLLWYINKWRPIFVFDFNSVRGLFGFSMNLLGTNVLIVLFNNIYTLIIGKFYNVQEVGYYNQAKKFQDVPTSSITSVIQSVTYPVLSKLQDNNNQLKEAYRRVINMAIFINFPIMLGLMACSGNLFILLLNDNWLPSIPYFKILCVYGALFPLHSINVNILKVKNKTKKLFKLEVVRRLIVLVSIGLTLKLGMLWLLVGSIVASVLSILINMYYCGKEIELKVKVQLLDVTPIFMIALCSSFAMYLFDKITNYIVVNLLIQIIIGIIVYIGLCKVFKVKSFTESIKIAKEKLKI